MADYPDFYADGFSISSGTFGITVTLLRSEPTGEPGAHVEPNAIVGRIRLSPQFAEMFAAALSQAAANAKQAPQNTQTTIKH